MQLTNNTVKARLPAVAKTFLITNFQKKNEHHEKKAKFDKSKSGILIISQYVEPTKVTKSGKFSQFVSNIESLHQLFSTNYIPQSNILFKYFIAVRQNCSGKPKEVRGRNCAVNI